MEVAKWYVVVVFVNSVYGLTRVRTRLGMLEGSTYVTNTGRQVLAFRGVPYAKPPVGPRRFKEPEPIEGWREVRQATDFGAQCAQYFTLVDIPEKIIGEEDCLYLNVFVPAKPKRSGLPVVVYFHGGGFMCGASNDLGPDFLFDRVDIVFVSVNYRLGPFGFLSTQDDVVPGNNGLKDQVMALKWVKDNIDSFGGDKNKVTIAGNSAGGASVHYHYLSPLSRGLFQKGISSSGCALNPWALTEESLEKAKMLARSLNCPSESTDILVECLRRVSAYEILRKIEPLFFAWRFNPLSPFGPVIEKSIYSNPFLADPPFYILKNGQVFDGPWLAGDTTEEGLFPTASFMDREEFMQMLRKEWYRIAPHIFDFNFTVPNDRHQEISDKVKRFYLNGKDVSKRTRNAMVKMLGDRMFNSDMDLAARTQASSSNVFFYLFGYRGNISLTDATSAHKRNYGVSHFDDMYYVLSLPDSHRLSDTDKKMVHTMTDIWASFILEGKPSLPGGVRWRPVSQEADQTGSLSYLQIRSSNKMAMKNDDNFGNRRFWKSLGLDENVNYDDLLAVDSCINREDESYFSVNVVERSTTCNRFPNIQRLN